MSFKADVNSVDNLGQAAIFYSCREGRLNSSKVLVEHGAVLNRHDKSRNTPLSWARRSGNQALVDFLVSKGAADKPSKKKHDPKTDRRKNEKRIKCQLMVADENGDRRPLTEEELKEFELKHPDIAKYWLDPSSLSELDRLDQDAIDSLRPWEKPAKKLLNTLWRNHNSWIFHEKVDPVQLNIPDYFDVVKNPMDFGTIKKKLNGNVYCSALEFLRDVELVFSNCKLYNPPGSDVNTMCNHVQHLYESQLPLLGLDKYRR